MTDKIWQSAVVTIVAQAGTLPLTIMLFNRFPTYFILANITIVPLSNLLIITGCLVLIVFPVQFLSQFLAMLLNWLTGLTEQLTSRAASLPYSSIENIGITNVECILLTISIFLFIRLLLSRKSIPVFYPLLFMTLFVLAGAARDISSRTRNELIIYNTPGKSTIGIKTGKILNLYSDTSLVSNEVKRHCSSFGLRIRPTRLTNSHYCIRAGEKKILISNYLNKNIVQEFVPDIVILTGSKPAIENNVNFLPSPAIIIFPAGVAPGFRIPEHVVTTGIDSIHFVRKSGAFVRQI